MSNQNKLLVGSIFLTVVGTLAAAISDSTTPTSATVTESSATTSGLESMPLSAYAAAAQQLRDIDSSIVDLLTAPVAPGDEVVTEVSIQPNTRAEDLTAVGPGQDIFEILEVSYKDTPENTIVYVRAKNNGMKTERFMAVFHPTSPVQEIP